MGRLQTLEKEITAILERSEAARNSDDELKMAYYEIFFGRPRGVITIDEIYGAKKSKLLPAEESISRIRRKVTETRPELRGNSVVEDGRYYKQTEYLDYVKG